MWVDFDSWDMKLYIDECDGTQRLRIDSIEHIHVTEWGHVMGYRPESLYWAELQKGDKYYVQFDD